MTRTLSPSDELRDITAFDVARMCGFKPNGQGKIQCPFHSGDHTASLQLYPDDRGWYCFGCNKGGQPVNFVMQYYNINFGQALYRMKQYFQLGNVQTVIHKKRKSEEEKEQKLSREYHKLAAQRADWWRLLVTMDTPLWQAYTEVERLDVMLDDLSVQLGGAEIG